MGESRSGGENSGQHQPPSSSYFPSCYVDVRCGHLLADTVKKILGVQNFDEIVLHFLHEVKPMNRGLWQQFSSTSLLGLAVRFGITQCKTIPLVTERWSTLRQTEKKID